MSSMKTLVIELLLVLIIMGAVSYSRSMDTGRLTTNSKLKER